MLIKNFKSVTCNNIFNKISLLINVIFNLKKVLVEMIGQ